MHFLQALLLLVCLLGNVVWLLVLSILGNLAASFGSLPWSQYVSRVQVVILLAMLTATCYVFNVVCLVEEVWIKIIFNIFLFLTLSSFLKTVFTNPGTIECPEWQAWQSQQHPVEEQRVDVNEEVQQQCILGGKSWCSFVSSENSVLDSLGIKKRGKASRGWAPGEVTNCINCGGSRPERAHHCNRCGVCVLRMDHHCPMVGTCIGWRNRKYFILLQWWQFWTSVIFLTAPRGPGTRVISGAVLELGAPLAAVVDITAIWAFVLMIITGRIFVETLYMAMRNRTSVEDNYEGPNPYELPTVTANLRQLFGGLDWRLLLPVEPNGRQCQGVRFPHNSSVRGGPKDQEAHKGYGAVN